MSDLLELRVRPDLLAPLVRLGLLEPRAIPASQVRAVLLAWPDSKARKVPLEQRVRQGLRALRA